MTTLAFDLDGTLIHSASHFHHAVNAALGEMRLPLVGVEDIPSFVGRGLPVFCERVIAHIGAETALRKELYDRTMVHYVNVPSTPQLLYPGVIAALTGLQSAGHRLTLCTNKPLAATETALAGTGLAPFFDVIIGGDSLPTRKPEPEMLVAALDGCPLEEALFFGDSETDCETAQAAGARFVLYTEGYRKTPPEGLPHVARFDDWLTVPDLVNELLA